MLQTKEAPDMMTGATVVGGVDAPMREAIVSSVARPVVNHYVHKAEITASIVLGTPGTALCGERIVARSRGGGSVSVASAVVCGVCSALFDRMAR